MGIVVKNETLPIGDFIVFTMCDHSAMGIGKQMLAAIFGNNNPVEALSQVTCNPTGVPMYPDMVNVLIDNLSQAKTMATPNSRVELVFSSSDEGVDNPKIRVALDEAIGLIMEVRVDSAIYMEGTMEEVPGGDDRDYIRGTLEWDLIDELIASMREELAVYRAAHPAEPDDSVGAKA